LPAVRSIQHRFTPFWVVLWGLLSSDVAMPVPRRLCLLIVAFQERTVRVPYNGSKTCQVAMTERVRELQVGRPQDAEKL
jgi:hypothetical protein